MKKSVKGFEIKHVILIIIITAITTSITTGIILINRNRLLLGNASLMNDHAIEEFMKVYTGLEKNYYGNINKNEMIDAAIKGMLDYLGEDYSTYLNQEETDNLAEELSGQYKGIGISITEGNKVVKVFDNTPAKRAGMEENDLIVNVNGTDTTELSQIEIVNLIDKTKENTIEVERNGIRQTYHITPEKINYPLTRALLDNNIGYIRIDTFSNTVGEEFKKAYDELEKENMTSLIIDLRSNSGGYLKGASEVASIFIEKGKTIYYLESKEKKEEFKDDTEEKKDIPIIILVNEGTASASEVLAAALKESYGATLVGKTTYGKGRVQQTKKLEDGSMVKYTTALWLTPSGECIDEYGIDPDYDVGLEKNEEGIYEDTQLQKAQELLTR